MGRMKARSLLMSHKITVCRRTGRPVFVDLEETSRDSDVQKAAPREETQGISDDDSSSRSSCCHMLVQRSNTCTSTNAKSERKRSATKRIRRVLKAHALALELRR